MSLSTLLALSVLAQRGAPQATTRAKFVTTDYFRRTDPAFLGVLRDLRLPAGRTFLLPTERDLRLTPMKNPSVGGGNGVFRPITDYMPKGGYGSILNLPTTTVNLSFGELPPGSGSQTVWYHGVASEDGTMTVGAVVGKTPIAIARVETLTGEIEDGQPVVANVVTPSDGKMDVKVKVAAGQGYRIAYAFDPKGAESGTYVKDATLDDGHLTTMHFVAKVIDPKTYLGIDVAPKGLLVRGSIDSEAKIDLTLQSSNVPNPKVHFEIANAGALAAQGIAASVTDTVAFGTGKKGTATLKVRAQDDTLDVTGTIMVQVTEDSGKPIATFPVPYEAWSSWVEVPISKDTLKWHVEGKFLYNSSGIWVYKGTDKNNAAQSRILYSFYIFSTPKDGKYYGISDQPTVAPNSTYTASYASKSDFVRDRFKYLVAGTVFLIVSDTPEGDKAEKAARNFTLIDP